MNDSTDYARINIPFFVVITGQACSLKCRDCGNLTPYAPSHTMRYDILEILDALRQILSLSVIDLLQIQGGEAFLYPNLAELLEFVLENKAVNRVCIATNGTLMPNVGLDLLRNSKLHVRISDYKHLSRKSAELKEYLDRNNVANHMYSFASHKGLWYKLDDTQYSTDTASKYSNCVFKHCLTLENGVIGHCSRAVIAQQIQGFSIDDSDFLIVDESDDFGRRLREYVNHPHSMQACCYCNGSLGSELVEAAIQI